MWSYVKTIESYWLKGLDENIHISYEKKEVIGYIQQLSIKNIHVPLKHRKIFNTILIEDKSRQDEFKPPRYKIELAYGNRFEPWIVSVQHMDS